MFSEGPEVQEGEGHGQRRSIFVRSCELRLRQLGGGDIDPRVRLHLLGVRLYYPTTRKEHAGNSGLAWDE